MKPIYSILVALSLGLAATNASSALLQVHEKELLKSCQILKANPAAVEAVSCSTYINGFLDGALVTDADNADELKEVAKGGFMERALRTRLGERESEQSFLHFCVPESTEKADVIEQLAPYLLTKDGSAEQLKQAIYYGLKAEYPCAK